MVQLLLAILAHAALGVVLFGATLLTGIAIEGWGRDGARKPAEAPCFTYCYGTAAVGLLGYLSLWGAIAAWSALGAMILLVGYGLHRCRTALPQLASLVRPFALGAPAILLFVVVMGIAFHGPTSYLGGSPFRDETFYASRLAVLATNPAITTDLGVEGLPFDYNWSKLLPVVYGAPLYRLGCIDPYLFLVATAPVSMCGWLLLLFERRAPEPGAAGSALAAALLLAATPGYVGWLVESPPVGIVLPLAALPLEFYRRRHAPGRLLAVAVLALLIVLVSKPPALSYFLPALLLPLILRARERLGTRAFAGLGLAVLVGIAGLGLAIIALNMPYFMAMGMDQLQPLPPILGHALYPEPGDPWFTRLGAVADPLWAMLVIVAAFGLPLPTWLRVAILIAALSAAWLPNVAMISLKCAAATVAFVALHERRVTVSLQLLLYLVAVVLVIAGAFRFGTIGLVALLLFLAALASPVILTRFEGRLGPLLAYVGAAAAIAALLAVGRFSAAGDAYLAKNNALSRDYFAIWQKAAGVPPDALIFTDQAELLEATTFPLRAARQIFLASWYDNAVLRNDQTQRDARLKLNQDVLTGRARPSALRLSRPYSAYFAVMAADRAAPANFREVDRAGALLLYRIED